MKIRETFDKDCSGLKVNKLLIKKIFTLETSFVNKNEDSIEFFGGTLTGVQVVRFTTEDREKFFSDILNIDESMLQDDLYDLREADGKTPVLNQEFKVSSDVFSLSCVWLMHAIHISPYISDKDKTEAKIRVCLYVLYRFLTSRLYRHFRYPANKASAIATYEALTYKFTLKKLGSWSACLRDLAEKAISPKSSHFDTIATMSDDEKVIGMLNDVQGRIRTMLKNIYNVFIGIHERGIKISKNNALVEIDGEVILKDKTKSIANYSTYIKKIIPDKNSFIKEELLNVVFDIMHTMQEKTLVQALEWTSSNYGHSKLIDKAVDATMDHAFDFLFSHKSLIKKKAPLADMIGKLRGTYMSSRSVDKNIVAAREASMLIIKNSTKTKNESVIAAARTGWMLYIVIRALSMKHYSH